MAKNKTNIRRRTRRRSHRRHGRKTKVHNKSKKYRKQRKLRGGESYAPTDSRGRTEINTITKKPTLGSDPGERNRSIQRRRAREAAEAAATTPTAKKSKFMGRIKQKIQNNVATVTNTIQNNVATVTDTIKTKASEIPKRIQSSNGDNTGHEIINPAFAPGM